MKPALRLVVWLGAVGAFVACCGGVFLVRDVIPGMRAGAQEAALLRRLNVYPTGTEAHRALDKLLRDLLDDPELRSLVLQPEGELRTTATMARAGFPRLPADRLRDYFQANAEALRWVDVDVCARIARGKGNDADLVAAYLALERVDTERVRRYFEAVLAAIRAQHAMFPEALPRPSDPEINAILRSVLAARSGRDQERMRRVVRDLAGASDSEACWFLTQQYSDPLPGLTEAEQRAYYVALL